jgi:hypothetical protein
MLSRPGAADPRFSARPTGANSFRLRADENRRPNFSRSPAASDVDMKDASPASTGALGRFRPSPASSAASFTFSYNRHALRERPTTSSYRSAATSALQAATKTATGEDGHLRVLFVGHRPLDGAHGLFTGS